MSVESWLWDEDPLPVRTAMGNYDTWKSTEPGERWRLTPDPEPHIDDARCEQCWLPAYGSFPGHVFCKEHFYDHERKALAAMIAKSQQGAA